MTATCNVMVSCWIKYTKLARQWQALKPAKKSNTKMKGNQSTPNPTQVFLLHAKWLGNLPRRGREQYTTYLSIHLSIHSSIDPSIHRLAATILGLKEMDQVGKPPQTSSARPSWGLKAVRIGVTARPSTSKQDTFLVQKKGDTKQGFQCVNLWGHVNVSICKNVHTNIASFYLSIYLPTYLSIYLSLSLIFPSVYLSTYLPYTYLSIYLSIHRPIDWFIDLSIYTHCITLLLIAVVPHKVVAEVSKIGSL